VSSRLTPKRVHPVRGSFVLIEYLIPPKNTAIAQGEHVFFDIDVKGGEKEWSRLDATVGGPNRLACSRSGLPSMPKGEIVGMFTGRCACH
jgi:hypothetical protein